MSENFEYLRTVTIRATAQIAAAYWKSRAMDPWEGMDSDSWVMALIKVEVGLKEL